MSFPFSTQCRVEFADTDMAGIAHFTAILRYMEIAEHEFLRHLGLSVFMTQGTRKLSWPRVSARCDFLGPVRFEDVLRVEVGVDRITERSVTYAFLISRDGRTAAKGQMTCVCCVIDHETPTGLTAVDIPPSIADSLRAMRVPQETSREARQAPQYGR